MNHPALAIHGGPATIPTPLAPFVSVGEAEAQAAAEVVRSGVLSAYIGAQGDAFMGGPRVRALEAQAAEFFGVRHAIAVNSWTSGLIAAVAALGLEPGDEVITTPWTMAATATAILHCNALPVFADIDPRTFNIDPQAVERLVTPRTRAILSVDIFGQSADMQALRKIADRHGLKLLSDTAQAPGARAPDGRFAGLQADIGGYSLNYHKHIHCGEGGILVTNDDRLAWRMQMLRNHAEAVVESEDPAELAGLLGFNFRLGEIEAAIASIQLTRLAERVESRQRIARQLDQGLKDLRGLRTPEVAPGCTHVYYVYGMVLQEEVLGVPRASIAAALRAEGVPGVMAAYQNLHLLPLFRHKIAYGRNGFPWNSPYARQGIAYGEGTCPVAEELHSRTFLGLALCMNEYPPEDVELVIQAFRKVWASLDSLRGAAPR
jgi:perosamine synthetase